MTSQHDTNGQPSDLRRGEANGIISLASPSSFAETFERLRRAIQAHGLTLFATIDHSGEAERAGLSMRPTTLLIFGSPIAGTPLMVASPLLALDLPLKALVWQDTDEHVWVSYNSPAYLAARHAIPAELTPNIAGTAPLIASALRG